MPCCGARERRTKGQDVLQRQNMKGLFWGVVENFGGVGGWEIGLQWKEGNIKNVLGFR